MTTPTEADKTLAYDIGCSSMSYLKNHNTEAFNSQLDHAASLIAAHLAKAVAEAVLDAQLSKAESDAQIYVPGSWECPKCNFQLTKSYLHPNGISPNLDVVEPCPNDGETMVRSTWKKDAIALSDRLSIEIPKLRDAEATVSRLEAELAEVKGEIEKVSAALHATEVLECREATDAARLREENLALKEALALVEKRLMNHPAYDHETALNPFSMESMKTGGDCAFVSTLAHYCRTTLAAATANGGAKL